MRILVYLDDGLCAVTVKQVALKASQLVHSTLAIYTQSRLYYKPSNKVHLVAYLVPVMARVCHIDVELGLIEMLQKSLLFYSVL